MFVNCYKIIEEQKMHALAAMIAQQCPSQAVIYLQGDLGVGKTTWTRGFLRALGYTGKVKSPSFTLVETYDINTDTIYHLDCYRLSDSDELEYLGIRDYQPGIMIVEWPDKGRGYLPKADMTLVFEYHTDYRLVTIRSNILLAMAI